MGLTPLAVHVIIFQKETISYLFWSNVVLCATVLDLDSHSLLWHLADVVTSFQFQKTFTYLRRYIKSTSRIHLGIRFNLS